MKIKENVFDDMQYKLVNLDKRCDIKGLSLSVMRFFLCISFCTFFLLSVAQFNELVGCFNCSSRFLQLSFRFSVLRRGASGGNTSICKCYSCTYVKIWFILERLKTRVTENFLLNQKKKNEDNLLTANTLFFWFEKSKKKWPQKIRAISYQKSQ